jgi:mannose-6-phosphate isomerase-like protein (cupin superfamily)
MQIKNISDRCRHNDYFRQVLATGKHTQIVIMSIPPGGEIGEEVHKKNDQVLYLVQGAGQAVLDGQASSYSAGDVVLVPAGTKHNFIANSSQSMKIITTYSPPHHPDGTVHKTKADADAEEKKKKVAISTAATTAATFQVL